VEFIAPMSVLITIALVVGSISRSIVVNRRLRENSRTWAEVQGKLIDKFGSADEVVRYLETEASRELLSGQSSAPANPHARLLDSVHLGVLTLAGGIGFAVAAGLVRGVELAETMRVLGVIGGVVGIGFLVSAATSWLLMRSWEVLPTRERSEGA